ncbi:MAG: ATP-dependent zinc metalloprotease FtsH, partial [Betaproteobacteria bacterium]|nr:ATP-dependent zinc metalloprotease FtsH [Betaproteobacteria bacterium]
IEILDERESPAREALNVLAPLAMLAAAGWILLRARRRLVRTRQPSSGLGKQTLRGILHERPLVQFSDVAGCDEAKNELEEFVMFLREPERLSRLGGRIPKGALLFGPPGTGKTLLARAIAGEAKVPFFAVSGSDFVEMYVGVGASRVRDLFAQARQDAPCIIFIDEIDAVGRVRNGSATPGGGEERESTLNQLLVEMDGFDASTGIILIAASNRSEILDPALLRPGRLDRHIYVGLPDLAGRSQILSIYLNRMPIAKDVVVDTLARATAGLSGAELASLANEAAVQAARRGISEVTMSVFEGARDRLLLGSERKSFSILESERRLIAYHETGHAIVAHALAPDCDPVHKITIIARGGALGMMMQLPEGDLHSVSRSRLDASMTLLCAGRAAEALFLGQITTGATQDLQRATAIARDLVFNFGMGEALGPMVIGEVHNLMTTPLLADALLMAADLEVRALVIAASERAHRILMAHSNRVHAVANALLARETLSAHDFQQLLALADQESSGATPKDSICPDQPAEQ